MKVSVIVPVHNGEKTIDRCLESIYASSFKTFEVILVDDGSTDMTLDKASKYPCKVIKIKKNKGVANARNVGARHVRSGLLVFIDSDVFIHKGSLSKMINYNHLGSKIIGGADSGRCSSKGYQERFIALKYAYDYKWKRAEMSRTSPVFTSEFVMCEKEIFDKVGGFDTKYKKAGVEEFDLGYRLWEKGYFTTIYKDILYDHHGQNLSKRSKTLFMRAAIYVPLFFKKKRFGTDGSTATLYEAMMAVSSALFLFSLVFIIIPKGFLVPLSLLAVISLILSRFLVHMAIKGGILFCLFSLFASLYLYSSIGLGVIYGIARNGYS